MWSGIEQSKVEKTYSLNYCFYLVLVALRKNKNKEFNSWKFNL